jgi:hypothetical protein
VDRSAAISLSWIAMDDYDCGWRLGDARYMTANTEQTGKLSFDGLGMIGKVLEDKIQRGSFGWVQVGLDFEISIAFGLDRAGRRDFYRLGRREVSPFSTIAPSLPYSSSLQQTDCKCRDIGCQYVERLRVPYRSRLARVSACASTFGFHRDLPPSSTAANHEDTRCLVDIVGNGIANGMPSFSDR